MHRCVLGIDIGGTNIRAGLIAPDYSLHHFMMERGVIFHENPADQIGALEGFIRRYCGNIGDGFLPAAISIGFPSTLNKEKTVVLSTPNLPGFENLPVVEKLGKRLGLPVFINKDVNLLLTHDMREMDIQDASIVLGCYIGTGLGNAIYIHGEILAGCNGVAGELGHMPLLGHMGQCGCGNTGCMETIASGRHLQELRARHFAQDELADLFTKYSRTHILQTYIEGLSIPIATEVNVFDPDYVILGGGVLQMQDFPIEYLTQCILRHTRRPLPFDNLQIKVSSPHNHNGVIGAGILAHSKMPLEAIA